MGKVAVPCCPFTVYGPFSVSHVREFYAEYAHDGGGDSCTAKGCLYICCEAAAAALSRKVAVKLQNLKNFQPFRAVNL